MERLSGRSISRDSTASCNGKEGEDRKMQQKVCLENGSIRRQDRTDEALVRNERTGD